MTKKFGEEAFEVVIAAMKDNRDELIAESADVLYHLFVLLQAQDVTFAEVEALLGERHEKRNNFKGERQDIEEW
nr:phosphoribosyl-ATP diphosphatase [Staphylococcus pseudintermedius]